MVSYASHRDGTLSADVILARSGKHCLMEGHAVVRLDLVVRVVQWVQQHLHASFHALCPLRKNEGKALYELEWCCHQQHTSSDCQ
jgi:hypothetical protein